MKIDINTTVGQIAQHVPGAIDIFEQAGIDYCCRGERTLEAACREAGTMTDELTRRLEALTEPAEKDRLHNWQIEPLFVLTSHIVNHHHQYVRRELPRLAQMATHVAGVHGERHPDLFRLEVVLRALARELNMHMMKEEQILFPHIVRLEEHDAFDEGSPVSPFGSVENPIRTMMAEHDAAGEMLLEIRHLTSQFTPPADACTSFRQLYAGLSSFEVDLHEHIHLENNILFPRALELETNDQFAALSNI